MFIGGGIKMKQTTVAVQCEEEKVAAAKMYMKQKGLNFEEEVKKSIEVLYSRHVPVVVRDFIDMRSNMTLEVIGQKTGNRREG